MSEGFTSIADTAAWICGAIATAYLVGAVVAGLAAQTSLGAVFAGTQIAFSDAIRIGEVVVLEDEWGAHRGAHAHQRRRPPRG